MHHFNVTTCYNLLADLLVLVNWFILFSHISHLVFNNTANDVYFLQQNVRFCLFPLVEPEKIVPNVKLITFDGKVDRDLLVRLFVATFVSNSLGSLTCRLQAH